MAVPAPARVPLRVAFATDTYAPSVNGVVRSIQTSKAALERLGVQVSVFAPGTRSLASHHAEPGVRHMPSFETSFYPNLHLSVVPLLPRDLRGFDVVHVHTPGPLGLAALAAARREGIPVVYTYHTRFDDLFQHLVPFASAERIFARAAGRLERALLERASAIVAPTEAIAEDLAARDRHADVIPTGVDVEVFRPVVRVGPQGSPLFLHLGRLSREKNLDAVLRAFPHVLDALPDARLLIAGTGPDETRARRLAEELGLGEHIGFLGFVPETDLPSVYQAADVYVTASRFETQGLTVLEAMACGAAVALPDVPVFRSILQRGAAVGFDEASPTDVARGMVEAYECRSELAPHGLRLARETSMRACAARLRAIYERIVGEGPSSTDARGEALAAPPVRGVALQPLS